MIALMQNEAAAATQDSCKALVMSGGANNGAWEAGVLWGFVNYGNPEDFAYDVVTGVSVGSLNAFLASAYPKGQEKEMVQFMSDTWLNLLNSDVWANWTLSPVAGLITQRGFLDNRPLLNFLKNISADWDQFYRKITVSALDIETGKVKAFNQDNTSISEFYKAAFSSTCIPGVFPPYEWTIDGHDYMFSDNFIVGNDNPYSAV